MGVSLLFQNLQLHKFIHEKRSVCFIAHFEQVFNACEDVQTNVYILISLKEL